ncbi:TonB-dependent siderophore receptor [Colwellia sp. RSH04]|uniref:TonB-dependent receptor plug domain-containing protein n=1 Tax=Colwellia sp. RSH04 TaxID=2305464 RepID=UPI0015F8493E|nr:TonB-dependent receptor [Colwellia sp. RSH04]
MSISMKYISLSILTALSLSSTTVLSKNYQTVSFLPEEYFSEDSEDSLADFYGDEEFVSIATGNKVLIKKAPSVATVISATQIAHMGAKTVAEALENVPGLHVYPSPFNRMNNSFSIRGIHTDQNPQVLFLINGLPVREEYTGARPETFQMPVHTIERIEVIRGPGSAVYGADAYSGVINVITQDITALEKSSYGISYGSFNSSNAWYKNSFSSEHVNFGIAIESLKGDGDEDRIISRDLQSIFDDTLGTNASLTPAPVSTNYNILDVRLSAATEQLNANFWYWNNDDAGQGLGAAQALDPSGTQNTNIYQFDLAYDWQLSGWDAKVLYNYYQLETKAEFTILPAGALIPLGSDGNMNLVSPVGIGLFTEGLKGNPAPKEVLNSIDFNALSSHYNDHQFRVAIGVSQRKLTASEQKNFGPGVLDMEHVSQLFSSGQPIVVDGILTDVTNTPYVFVKDVERFNSYVSLQDQWKFANDWELTAGLRYDYYDDFGSTINPRLALVWEMTQSTSSKFLYGRAFRAPAFDTLYAINNPVGLGNPSLSPETIDTLEVSINQQLSKDFNWSTNVFAYESKNLIEFVPDQGTTTTTAQNARGQVGYGFESELSWNNITGLWKLNYSWQHSEDDETKQTIIMAPRQLFNAMYDSQITESLNFNAKLNWVGDRARQVGDTRPELDNYATVDVALHWDLDAEHVWKVSLIGKNITDESAFEPSHPLVPEAMGPISDYPIQGRSFYLQLSKNL